MSDRMVVVDGVRYRVEDAERLGLVADAVVPSEKAKTPKNKSRKAPANKSVVPDEK